MINEKEFQCYSPALYLFLLGHKIQPVKTGTNRRTNLPYAIFKESDELHTALIGWRETNPNK
ncbi:MAG: hypothetical protein ACYCYI_09170 [Saccharofermentanales bacterium]